MKYVYNFTFLAKLCHRGTDKSIARGHNWGCGNIPKEEIMVGANQCLKQLGEGHDIGLGGWGDFVLLLLWRLFCLFMYSCIYLFIYCNIP